MLGSTNYVMGMYEENLSPKIYYPGHGGALNRIDSIRLDSYYGTSKAFGEAICRQYSECYEYSRRVYVLRICSVRMPEYHHPYGDAQRALDAGEIERGGEEYNKQVARMKAMWHSRRDFAYQTNCCLADDAVEFGVFSGVSDNDRRWYSIEHARSVLGYSPRTTATTGDSPLQ